MKPYQKLLCYGLIYGIVLWGLFMLALEAWLNLTAAFLLLGGLGLGLYLMMTLFDGQWGTTSVLLLVGTIIFVILCMILSITGVDWFVDLTGIKFPAKDDALHWYCYPTVLMHLMIWLLIAFVCGTFVINVFRKVPLSDNTHLWSGVLFVAVIVAFTFNVLFKAVVS